MVALIVVALCALALGAWTAVVWRRLQQTREALRIAQDERTLAVNESVLLANQTRLALATAAVDQDARIQAQRRAEFLTHQVDLLTATIRNFEESEAVRIAEDRRMAAQMAAEDAERLRQAEQRAADLEVYRAYLYDLMPEVCRRAGLDASLISSAWPVPSTGKLNDVFHHLGALDQRGHPIATLGDVIDLFVGRA